MLITIDSSNVHWYAHLKYMRSTCQCTLVMYLSNVRKLVGMNIFLDVHLMYMTMHIGNVHYQCAICGL